MRLFVYLAGGLIALVTFATVIVFLIGNAIEPRHSTQVARSVLATPAEVAKLIRNVEAYPSWRHGVSISDLQKHETEATYVETAFGDVIAYRLDEKSRDKLFVATITDKTLPFGGTWTFEISTDGGATTLMIREDGVIRDPFYRFFAKYVFGYDSSIVSYLNSLETELEASDHQTGP